MASKEQSAVAWTLPTMNCKFMNFFWKSTTFSLRDKSEENPEPKFKSEGYYVNVWGTELKPDDKDYADMKNWKLIDNQVFIENTNPEFQNSKKSWLNKVGSKIDVDENENAKITGMWWILVIIAISVIVAYLQLYSF